MRTQAIKIIKRGTKCVSKATTGDEEVEWRAEERNEIIKKSQLQHDVISSASLLLPTYFHDA